MLLEAHKNTRSFGAGAKTKAYEKNYLSLSRWFGIISFSDIPARCQRGRFPL